MTNVWISRDKGIYEGIWLWDSLPVWSSDGTADCNGDGMKIDIGPKFALKPGQLAKFEIRRVK